MTTKKLDAEKRLQLLVQFGIFVSKERRLDSLLELLAGQVSQILNGDRCTVFLCDHKAGVLVSKVAQGMKHTEIRVPLGRSIAGLVAATGESVNIPDAYADQRFSPDIDRVTGYKTRAVLAVPLKNNKGEILGVFQVLNKAGGHAFDEDDKGLLLLLASVAAGAIENAKLYEEIKRSQLETIYRLAITAEYRDQKDTARHLENISIISYLLATALGFSKEEAEDIKCASPLHDIGKVGVKDAVLLKPGRLNDEEQKEMRLHTLFGAKILANAESSLLQLAHRISVCHHEKYDGSGYPKGLKGDSIPYEARIIAVADVFDALCMPRIYKPAWPVEQAYDHIVSGSGTLFDPKVVNAFKAIYPTVRKLYGCNTVAEPA
ncbi:MAG: GAF domain-containing protein [Elusimicrobia bacterium]|nr:GAF domain-containing protein [Elusimicrobiota bacterium]